MFIGSPLKRAKSTLFIGLTKQQENLVDTLLQEQKNRSFLPNEQSFNEVRVHLFVTISDFSENCVPIFSRSSSRETLILLLQFI